MDAGKRDDLITFQRATVTTDDHGGETLAWSALQQGWAQVLYGSAKEKREAAQEGANQSATFELDPNPVLRDVTAKDQILFDGSAWDIQGPGERLERSRIRFTATRSI